MKNFLFLLLLVTSFSCTKEIITEDFVLESRAVSEENPCIDTNVFPELLTIQSIVHFQEGDINADPVSVTFKVKDHSTGTYDWCVVDNNGEVVISKEAVTLCIPYVLFRNYGELTVYAQSYVTSFWGASTKSLCEIEQTC